MPNLRIFGVEFKNTFVIFEMWTASSNLSCCKVWCKNKNREKKFPKKPRKCLNLAPKMPCLGISGQNLKTIFSYMKSTPRICLIAKFREKTKIPKFESKNA